MESKLTGMWLTVNRKCNFRCPWCYAESTNYSEDEDMPLELAKSILDMGADLGIKEVMLIGGEPTYYPHLFEIIQYIHDKKMKSTLVTNGYRFSDINFLKELENTKLNSVGISIKGGSKEQYIQATKVDAYDNMKVGIKNLAKSKKFIVGYSVVLSKEVLPNLEDIARLVALNPDNWLLLSFCGPIFCDSGEVVKEHMPSREEVIKFIIENFSSLDKILQGHINIEQAFPVCLWPSKFLDELIKKNQIRFGCHVQTRSGLIFNGKGELIICNSLPNFSIGQFGKEFKNAEEFQHFWNNTQLKKFYKRFHEYPAEKCKTCKEYIDCGGGCPLHWFAYDAQTTIV